MTNRRATSVDRHRGFVDHTGATGSDGLGTRSRDSVTDAWNRRVLGHAHSGQRGVADALYWSPMDDDAASDPALQALLSAATDERRVAKGAPAP